MAEAPYDKGLHAHNKTSYTAICTIEDSFAHIGCYLVRAPSRSMFIAVDMFQSGGIPLGARPIGGYSCKTQVLVQFDRSFEFPLIVGVVPKGLADARLVIPESLTMRSRAGQFEDPMHFSQLQDKRLVWGNFSSGRPVDTLPGDWGGINDMGMAIYLGRLIAALKASDSAKLEAFWGDDLMRMTAYNWELFTAGRENRWINDEGEYNEISGSTPYPWEGMGCGQKGTETAIKVDGKLKPGSEKASYEPYDDNQLGIRRHLVLGGYLGDVEREIVSVPPDGLDHETFSAKTKHVGLLEVIKSSDGTYCVRSAKGIFHEKYCLIPVPKEMYSPEDPKGDSKKNGYQAAGASVQVPDYKFGDESKPGIRGPQIYDYLAYVVGRYTCAGLAKKKKDWYYPEESELSKPVQGSIYDKGFSALQDSFELDLPTSGTLKVDHRGGRDSVKYFQSRSLIGQLDDGSIVIEDGYGAGIRLGGGNIFTSAPGDIFNLPGRSYVVWAPFDAIMRAGNCAEMTASKGDVRLKAEKNLHMLGGNSGDVGGILIESRSYGNINPSDYAQIGQKVTSHGIVLKSEHAPVHTYAQSVYIGVTQDGGGDVVLDADVNRLYMRGNTVIANIQDLFSVYNKDQQTIMAMTPSGACIATQLMVGGGVIIADKTGSNDCNLIVGGTLAVHQNIIADGNVAINGGYVSYLAPTVSKTDRKILFDPSAKQLGADIKAQVKGVAQLVDPLEKQVKTDDNAPGLAANQKKIGFSCRDSKEDLKLDESTFIIYESRWQQIMRSGGGGGQTWNEPVVKAPSGQETKPHPGKDALDSWQAFGTVELNNFSLSTGKATGTHLALHEKGAGQQKKSLSTYQVVKGPSS